MQKDRREKIGAAIIGTGNIGTDLMIKIKRLSEILEVRCFVGIDPNSEGLKRAERMGIPTTFDGVGGLIAHPNFDGIEVVFDATSASAHVVNDEVLRPFGKTLIDMTPAALGPYVVPSVNLDSVRGCRNVNMVTCGGQATIPIIAAINDVSRVIYGEIVASISSRSAGPGTRANIDEFTETTARAIEKVGGAVMGKAIIILNPAEPPLVMRDTVLCLVEDTDPQAVAKSVGRIVSEVQTYVPGYRLKHEVQIEPVSGLICPGRDAPFTGLKVSAFLEVEGAAHYLPKFAGNLDIMTSAALRTAERIVSNTFAGVQA